MRVRHRILMTADSVGGVFQHAIDLARGLRPLGFDTVLAVLGPRVDAAQLDAARAVADVVETDLPLDWLARDRAQLVGASDRLASLADAHRASIVHLNTPGIATDRFDMPVVVASHSCLGTWWQSVRGGAMPDDFLWRVDAVTSSMTHAGAVVCPTQSFAHATARVHGGQPRAVHNGRSMGSRRSGWNGSDFAFTAGRLWDEGKDFGTFDAAAALLRAPFLAAGPLTGPNGARSSCRHAFSLGALPQDRVRETLQRRPVFVSTAVYETFGLAVLEAAQAACPLVLADIATYRELWEEAAIFVPARDPEAFAEAIDRVMRDHVLREDAGEAAYRRSQRYTVDAMASGIAGIYASLGVVPA
jgi:glycogen synthase